MTRSFLTANSFAAAVAISLTSGSFAAPAQQGGYNQFPAAQYQQAPQAPQAPQVQQVQQVQQAQPSYGQPPQYTTTPYGVPPQAPPANRAYPNYPTAGYPTAGYQVAARPDRYAMQGTVPTPAEAVPQPQANSVPTNVPVTPVPVASGPTANYYPQADCGGCNTTPAVNSWGGYVQPQASSVGYAAGGPVYGGDAAACDYGNFGGAAGFGNALGAQRSNRQWFFGVYGLYMSRDNPGYEKLAVLVDSPAAYPYYPTEADTFLSTSDVNPDFRWGAEIRFGSTFGQAVGHDACGQGGGCDLGCQTACGPQPYAWEVVYWGLADDNQSATRIDALADSDRIYSSLNFAGLEYDRDGVAGGTFAYRPLNEYADYQLPIADPAGDPTAPRVLGVRVRSNFRAQNLELNFIRFPLAGCAPVGCGPPRFSLNGSCGVRYYKMDEDLQVAWMFTDPAVAGDPAAYTSFPTDDDNNFFYDVSTDNELVGFQLGSNMNWLIGSKWSAFCDTQFGVYGNNITNLHRVWSGGGGDIRFTNGADGLANVRSRKTDVAFLGEARLGVGYQVGCNVRWTTAYRVMAISGVALSASQLPNNFANAGYVGRIDSNDSLVLHGLQTGLEWKY